MPFPFKLVNFSRQNVAEHTAESAGEDRTSHPHRSSSSSSVLGLNDSSTNLALPPPPYLSTGQRVPPYTRGRNNSRKATFPGRRVQSFKSMVSSPRTGILLSLVILPFLVLILAFVFADCVALQHHEPGFGPPGFGGPGHGPRGNGTFGSFGPNGRSNMTSPDGISTGGIFKRRAMPPPSSDRPEPASFITGSPDTDHKNTTTSGDDQSQPSPAFPDTGNGANDTHQRPGNMTNNFPGQGSHDDHNGDRGRFDFDSPGNLAILFFYLATLPLLTLLQACTELITLFLTRRRPSQPQPPTHLSEIDESASPTKSKLPALSLATSVLLLLGWITTSSIQAHCEIHMPTLQPSQITPAMQAACPIQTRGRPMMPEMYKLSIAKNFFSWVVVLVYIGYLVYGWKVGVGFAGKGRRERMRLEEELERKVREKEWMVEGGMERERQEQLRKMAVGLGGAGSGRGLAGWRMSVGGRLRSGEWLTGRGERRETVLEDGEVVGVGVAVGGERAKEVSVGRAV